MARPTTNPRIIQFGLFELDLDTRELRKSGVRIKLQEQPFQILAVLLERRGEIVTREELQKRLWPRDTFVDFDLSLNSAVKKLRQSLSDDSENPRFIETLYRRGYRFIGQTNGTAETVQAIPIPTVPSQAGISSEAAPPVVRNRAFPVLTYSVPVLIIITVVAVWMARPSDSPRITGFTQITHDNLSKGGIVTDGERLYFQEFHGEQVVVAQVSAAGGETSILPIPFGNVALFDMADDGSALLVGGFEGFPKDFPLWSAPLPTGSPQRLNDLSGLGAAWSKDRSRTVVAKGSDVYLAAGNGSQPRKLTTVNGAALGFRFSPDGRRLRFVIIDARNDSSALWEVNRDGSGLHALLPGWNQTARECCGAWTADGKYYIFQSQREGRTNLWLLPEQRRWFAEPPKPVQLTNGPLNFSWPAVSRDGKKIFAVGSQPRTEVERYRAQSGFTTYLEGVSATDLAFSRNGQFVAYVSVPEGSLWRSRADGTQRLQLTAPPFQAALPRWSPDGKLIVFMGRSANANWRAYMIASGGGTTDDVLPSADVGFDPGWSPDGKAIVLTLNVAGDPPVTPSGPGIAIADLLTKKVSLLQGAARLFSPRWSPDGRYIAAVTDDTWKLELFDRVTQKWSELTAMPTGYPSWSHDGTYLYFNTTLVDDPAFFRIRISDRKLERLVSLKGLRSFEGEFGEWTGLAPDDSLLVLRDTSSQEIYALSWQAP